MLSASLLGSHINIFIKHAFPPTLPFGIPYHPELHLIYLLNVHLMSYNHLRW